MDEEPRAKLHERCWHHSICQTSVQRHRNDRIKPAFARSNVARFSRTCVPNARTATNGNERWWRWSPDLFLVPVGLEPLLICVQRSLHELNLGCCFGFGLEVLLYGLEGR